MSIFNSVLFAVNREDHYVEYDVINRLDPSRMLMIGSGGCIALSIKTTYPNLDLNVIDVNPHQLTHINKKSKAVQCSDLKELNVHNKNDSCLNQAGEFDSMFQELRNSFIESVSSKKEVLSFFDSELSDIDLKNWHLFKSIKINGPMWKICWDGYTDGYHHHMVHPETVGKNTIVNLIAHDTYGPHQRFAFGLKNINELSDIEEKDWEPENHLRLIHSVFPNSSISAIQNQHCLVSIIFPTSDLQGTITTQYILCLKEPKTKEEIKEAENFAELSRAAIIDEDYPINFKIQETIHSKANTEFLFGKNEPIQQHYHNWIEKLCNK